MLGEPLGSLPSGDLEPRHVAVERHVRGVSHHEQLLLGRGDQVECCDLAVPHRDVVALGDDHQRRRVDEPGDVGEDGVRQQQVNRCDGVSVLVVGSRRLFEGFEDRADFGEGPGEKPLCRISRHAHLSVLAGRQLAAPVVHDALLQSPVCQRPVRRLHRVMPVHDRNVRDDALDSRVRGSHHEDVTAAVRDPPDADAVRVDLGPGLQVADRRLVILVLIVTG